MMYYANFLNFQYFQTFASICSQISVKILANQYTWRLWNRAIVVIVIAIASHRSLHVCTNIKLGRASNVDHTY